MIATGQCTVVVMRVPAGRLALSFSTLQSAWLAPNGYLTAYGEEFFDLRVFLRMTAAAAA